MTKLCLLALVFALFELSQAVPRDAVLLTDIQALTFQRGQMTQARRTSTIPALTCVGGSAKSSPHQPDVVQCKNVGHDGYNVEWACNADLDESVRFGPVTVSCEGYSSSEDPYVLRGSCGLEYTLEYTNKGHAQSSHGSASSSSSYSYPDSTHYGSGGGYGFGSFFTFVLILVVVFGTLNLCARGQTRIPGVGGPVGGGAGYGPGPGGYGPGPGGYGPGGDGYGNGYTGTPGGYGAGYGGAPGYGYGSSSSAGFAQPPGGFWGGMAAGGLMSYLFRPRNYTYGSGYGYGGGYGSGLGTGYGYGGGYGGHTTGFGRSSFGGSSFGGGSTSTGTTTRTATGYGSSRRR